MSSWGTEAQSIRADFQADSLGHEVERLRDADGRRLKELDRRERLLERRERELNLLRERVNQHAAAKHFGPAAIWVETAEAVRRFKLREPFQIERRGTYIQHVVYCRLPLSH